MTGSVVVRAPAKINLHLGVGALREDGFHPLTTVYQAIGVYDRLTFRPGPGWSLSVSVAAHLGAAAVPPAEDNIVTRAADSLAARYRVPRRAVVAVDKAIPVAGGMAGGSADAAAALAGLARVWGLRPRPADLLALAADLGSDVPFALVGGTALGTGRGEVVRPVPDRGRWWWVVVGSREGLPTPAVYREWDRLFPTAGSRPAPADAVLQALALGDPRRLAAALANDLQPAACSLRPDLETVLARGVAEGALAGLVSGSGPTCVFLCETAGAADTVAAGLRGVGYSPVLTAPGPVAGPGRLLRPAGETGP